MNRKTVISMLATVLLIISIVFVSCGGEHDDNNQPEIESIDDKTLEIGDTQTANVRVTDIDVDDIHTISASSDNPNVATVSVEADSLTITGNAVGMTTITVTATDDSGQDTATSLPVTFQVTVNEPPPPPINRRLCVVGMTLKQGEGCTYITNQEQVFFYVNENSEGCRESDLSYTTEVFGLPVEVKLDFICADEDITGDEIYIRGAENPLDPTFHASKNSDGSWTIDKVP